MIDACFLDLPPTPYPQALALQRSVVAARVEGALPAELIIMVEHPPVFTLGRRGGLENLTVDRAVLEEKGIQVQHIERGGNITYHGPGQLVIYPIFNLNAARIRVVDYVSALEAAMARTVEHWGVNANGDAANRGAWVGTRKLGSIGITVRRGVAFHGLALNVNTDLTPFQWMNPCGIKDCEMTSVAREVGREVSMQRAREVMKQQLIDILQLHARDVDMAYVRKHLPDGNESINI